MSQGDKMNTGMLKEPVLSPTGPYIQNSTHLFKEFSGAILRVYLIFFCHDFKP